MDKDEWQGSGDSWFRLGTAGPSIFIDYWCDGVQSLTPESAEALHAWLGEMIEKMKAWEAQES